MKKLLLFFMSFFTIFGYAQFPEGFENASFPPTGWARFDNGIGLAQQWNETTNATLVHTGAKAAFLNRENVTDGTTALDWLVSPITTVPANGQLRFYTRKTQNGNFGSTYTIRVSTTSQTTAASFTTVQTWTEADLVTTYNVYEQKFVNLTAYAGQNIYIAFVMENDNGDRWLIDDINVDPICQVNTALTATPLATSATLNWTSPNPAGPWEIEYGPAGFVQGTGTIVSVTTPPPFNLTPLSPLTSYSYYVRTLCATDNPSAWSAVNNFQTSALPPVCGGNYVDSGGVGGNYAGNEDIIVTICPTNVGDYVTVNFTTFNTEATYDAVYVYNGASIASPQIASTNGAGNVPGGVAGGYWGTTIPGPFESTSPDGCLTFRFRSDAIVNNPGWTANVVCLPIPSCPKPTNVVATAASSTSLNVTWTNNAPGATQWEIIWLPAGSPAPLPTDSGTITSNPSPYLITGLTSATAYDVYVRAICSSGTDVGPWSTVHGTASTTPDYCAGDHFYDIGGPTGNYPNNANSVVTICPDTPGDVVTVYFNSFDLSSSIGDALTIYDGDNTTTGTIVGTYFGTNVISSYTSTSPSGCLTFSFVSNGSQNAAGWDASIICGPPCPLITSVLDSTIPAAGAENVIRICPGGSVEFNGSGTFAGDGTGATYEWDFDDGSTATGNNVTHTFTTEGIYLVNLTITDANGCRNNNRINQKVYVSTTPIFTGTSAYDDEICLGQSTTITGASTPVQFIKDCAPPVSGTTFLPDGSGISYLTTVPVDCFPFGSTITSASQITSVCIDMEHSYLGDLELRLVSPSGQFIILKAFNGTGGGGGGTYLGCAIDGGAGPGTGRTYCFTPTATTYLVNGATSNCGTPSSASINAGNYSSVDPFTNLIGSQLNGNWSLIVTDNLLIDDGYIFSWGINFDNSILPTDYEFTPTIDSSNWTPDPAIVSTSGNTITVTPTTVGTNCYTYNVTDNFGCTYSEQVCIEVLPGVSLTDITSNTPLCAGDNGTFTLTGSPNTTVSYNLDGGATQTVLLDGSGNATISLPALTATTTLNATYITAPAIPTSGNVISAVGGVNPNNSVGAISALGAAATTANCTTVNAANPLLTLTLANELPPGTPIIVSIARNNNAGSVTISDGVNSQIFNLGPNNVLQHVSFTTGTFTSTITITRNNGNTYVDGISYSYNELGCDAPSSLSETLVVNAIPTITVASPTCVADGVATISNYDSSFTYAFNPAGPTVGAGGVITNMVIGTTYTVTTSNATCPLGDSAPFSITAILTTPPTPTISTVSPTCSVPGSSSISNYDGTLTYLFTPAGPTVDATGLISGMVFGTSYTVISNNGNCDSPASAAFQNDLQLVTPVVPTISVAAPTCFADGVATITNYVVGDTYTFNPSGPSVDALGVISGLTPGTSYVVSANNGSCTSLDSASFSVIAILASPVAPTITSVLPTCSADGSSSISNYDGTLTYVFTPSGPSVDAAGLISGMVFGTSYTVISNNGNCDSPASAAFQNDLQLVTPVVPTISVAAPTCFADGVATITNYVVGDTYTFNPTGPSVSTSGVITGMIPGTNYVVSASNGSCTSLDSTSFSITAILASPVVPSISSILPNCSADGSSSISNYDGTLTYVFTPSGPSVDATGLISGMVLETGYTVVASNGVCNSGSSIVFSNSAQYISPVAPTVTVIDNLICSGETASFQINGTPNDIVEYSINGGSIQTVTIDSNGQAVLEFTNSTTTVSIELLEVDNGFCTLTLSINALVDVQNCTIPKGISPNGDGLNDNFDLSVYNIRRLEIFNRYGNKVYSKSNYEDEWYGQSDNGNELPDGTYYFVIDFTDLETKTGWIYINRERK